MVVPNVSDDHDYSVATQQPIDQLAAAQDEIVRLQAEVASLRQERSFVSRLSKDDELVTFNTGFPSYVTLYCILPMHRANSVQDDPLLATSPTCDERDSKQPCVCAKAVRSPHRDAVFAVLV